MIIDRTRALCCRGVFHLGEYDRKGGDSFSNHIDGFTSSSRDGTYGRNLGVLRRLFQAYDWLNLNQKTGLGGLPLNPENDYPCLEYKNVSRLRCLIVTAKK